MWPAMEHAPGFDPHGVTTSTVVKQTLDRLARFNSNGNLTWLETQRGALESVATCPLALSGVAAAALSDLCFTPDEGEMLYLLLRLPGAAAHALEQRRFGHKTFPFFGLELTDTAKEAV